MSRRESDFLKRLLATFQGEADERVAALDAGLVELEQTTDPTRQAALVEAAFREVHSLKGAARSVNLAEIESICQAMEDVFATLKRKPRTPSLPLLDALHQAADLLKSLLASAQTPSAAQDRSRHAPLIRQLRELARHDTPVAAEREEPPAAPTLTNEPAVTNEPALPVAAAAEVPTAGETRAIPAPETVRIATARLEGLLLQLEEMVAAKLAVGQRAAETHAMLAPLEQWDKRWARAHLALRRVSHSLEAGKQPSSATNDSFVPERRASESRGADSLGADTRADGRQNNATLSAVQTLLEFLEWNHTWVEQMAVRVRALAATTERDQRTLGGMVDHLLQDMKQLLMLPLASIVEMLPSVTRDIARQQQKEVHLVMRGTEIEVDRRILQEIKDPLLHLLRNCIDHGIESADERSRRGKPRRGTISLTVAQRDSNKFEVVVADDGGGIDLAKVRATAARLGLISPESAARLDEQATKSLIFQSGLSTSPLITDISGRGLGLAIVQEKVEKLGGTITVETRPGAGTTFILLLPLTLATLRGLLVQSAGQTYILPIVHVERVVRLPREEVQTVQNRETVRIDDQAFALAHLSQALELPRKPTQNEHDRIFVVLVGAAEKRIAFVVDAVIGEQEVLMKPLGAQLARVRNIAGATVLGNGQVIPILNVPDLLKSAVKTLEQTTAVLEAPPAQDKHILIVEDSITARMQLKNILELNGYNVQTAVDGLDALMALRTRHFDLVVSDVDMPRLNGLDLTARIRQDRKLGDMPVVLVTTLASRQDQARGIEVGANAYITKSNFDQNTLLDAVRRLI